MSDATATTPEPLPDDPRLPEAAGASAWAYALAVTLTAGVLLAIGFFLDGSEGKRAFWFSYLFGYVLALNLALGALFWVLIHHVSDAGWSVVLRRIFENLTRALPVLLVLFLPIVLGMGTLFRWASAEGDPLLEQKRPYLNPTFFLLRIGLYFAVWIALSVRLRALSLRQDETGDVTLSRRMRGLSFPGTLLLALTATFAAFDLVMSLNYAWYSTIFGVCFWVGGIRGSLSLLVLTAVALRGAGYLRNTITKEHLHDCGKLMFGFTIFWAYIAFSQYFLIWYGNVPEETQWYLRRRVGGWYAMSVLLGVVYFVVPFFLLLPQAWKRSPRMVAFAAAWILFFHAYDFYWQIIPEMYPAGFELLETLRDPEALALEQYRAYDLHLYWMSVAAAVLMTGVVACAALYGLRRHPMIPVRDPRLAESLAFHNDTQE